MGSKRFGGVLYVAHPDDHDPRHLHAFVGDGRVIIALTLDNRVIVPGRHDAVKNAKPGEVRKVVKLAVQHFDELLRLWEQMHD
ncbi:MAG: DUF4160 domain-containing protein [Firmicutes bacterium]|jgi:hypothetical protein|nr:DUF4160 domain-containing protein [Bacillota bacterium]